MYSSYHPAGDVLADAPQAVAILENGEEVLLSPADIFPEIRDKDLRFFVFNRNFVGPVLSADRATIGRRLESYVKSTGRRVQAIHIQTQPFAATHDGIRPALAKRLATIDLK
jgi:hypothetical protein